MLKKKRPALWFEKCEDSKKDEEFEDVRKEFGKPERTANVFKKSLFGMSNFPTGIVNTKNELLVRAKLPGFSKGDIRLKVSPMLVSITAQKKSENSNKEEDFFEQSSSSESASRILQLPVPVRTDKVKARYKDGMLEIILQKQASRV